MLKINNSGDTIVEVMIAVAIIGAVIIGATLSVNNSSATIQNSVYRQQATQLLQSQLELINAGNNESHNGGQTLNNLYASLNGSGGVKHLCAYQGAGYLNTNRYYRSNDIVTQVDSSNNESTWFYSYGVGSHSGVSPGPDLDASFTIPYSSNFYTTHNSGTQYQKKQSINRYLFSFSDLFISGSNTLTSGAFTDSTYSPTAKYSLGDYVFVVGSGNYIYINPIASIGHLTSDTTYWQHTVNASSYDITSTYGQGDYVIDSINHNHNHYISILSSNQGHKLNDTKYWIPMKYTIDSYNHPYYYDPAGIIGKSGVYYPGDVVSYNGDLYTVNQNLAATTTGDKPINGYGYWVPYEDTITTYSVTQSYSYGDIVNGYVYVASSPSVGQLQANNTTYWVKVGMSLSLSAAPYYVSGNTYSYGSVVQDPPIGGGSSSYIYINSTPTSGNPLPSSPSTSTAYWQKFTNSLPYNSNIFYRQGERASISSGGNVLQFLYINPVPQKGQPITSFLPLNYMSYVDLGYKDLNNPSANQEATTCNFDITGLNYIPSKSTNNPNLPNSPNSPFYSVDITITRDATNLSLYKIIGTVNWNGIGSQGQNSKVTLQQTIVSK